MLKVCIDRQTGGGRRPGHLTHFAFTGLPGVEIAALADENPAAKEDFHLCGAKKLYGTYEEMICSEKPDIAVLCSRLPEEHYRQIRFAMEHGCHVLCEKPLADSLPRAYELVELSQRTGCKVQLAHLARFAPAFREMKRIIQSGGIGRILTCYMRGKEDTRGGGEDMIVLGTHVFDAACWIFGLPETVYADVRWQGRRITAADTVETTEPVGLCAGDEIFAHFRFADGVNGIFESRRGLVPAVAEPRMGITVCGTEGSLAIRYSGDRALRICRNFPVPAEDSNCFEKVQLSGEDAVKDEEPLDYVKWKVNPGSFSSVYFAENNRRAARDLLQAIREGGEPAAGIESAVCSLEMITGIYQSAVDHVPVELPLKERSHPLAAAAGV